jgi:hypothetical protein
MARTQTDWPDIVFADQAGHATVSKAAREGRLVRIAPGLYSSRPRARQEDVVRRNWHQIVAHEFPDAVVSDRSARRSGPEADVLTIVHPRRRSLDLPGLRILPRSGKGPLPGDIESNGISFASQARAMLENLRGSPSHARYLAPRDIELWLADIVAGPNGHEQLNFIRDRARELAADAGWEAAFRRLDALIGAIFATRPIDVLETGVLRARAAGATYDHRRLELFEQLVAALQGQPPEPAPAFEQDAGRRLLLPFYEAYFSNHIEGTEFTLDEAAAIVYADHMPVGRPEDAHDILGTYRLVADPTDRRRRPSTAAELLALLLARHESLMAARPNKRPGRWKDRNNQVGSTTFVAPDLVEETLSRGFEVADSLVDPFARAVYLGFLVAEVHPFTDGNGRISRVMMNAELSAYGESRIIIPTVYRNNYLAGLRGASINANFASLPSILRFAQRYTAQVDFTSRESAEADLARTHALREPNEADDVGIRLQLPATQGAVGNLSQPDAVVSSLRRTE